jgi:hypothetical protein
MLGEHMGTIENILSQKDNCLATQTLSWPTMLYSTGFTTICIKWNVMLRLLLGRWLGGGCGRTLRTSWAQCLANRSNKKMPLRSSTGISAEMRTNLHDVQTFSQSFSRKPWTSFRSFIFICYYIDHLVHQFIHVTWFSKISMNEKDYFKLEWKHIFRFTTWQSILIIVKYPILVFCWLASQVQESLPESRWLYK